jgi:hypothetical protein
MRRLLAWWTGPIADDAAHDGAARLSFRLADPPEPWVLAAGFILVIVLVGLAYALEPVRGWRRWCMAALRMSIILMVMGAIARPELVWTRERVQPSVVAVLLDASASMAIAERTDHGRDARATRWETAIDAITTADGLLPRLLERHRVGVWSFSDAAQRAAWLSNEQDLATLTQTLRSITPEGTWTDITGALRTVIAASRGERLAGIIIVSDGRQTVPRAGDVASQDLLQPVDEVSGGPSVHAVAIGSALPRRDVLVRSLRLESDAFVGDVVPIEASLQATGYERPQAVSLTLTSATSGERLAEQTLEVGPDATITTALPFRPAAAGTYRLSVAAVPGHDEDDVNNNEASAVVRVHDRQIRVLYVEAEPRFEYRYLKTVLVREPGLESSILLLSAARGFAPEGTLPIRRFPVSVEEMNRYDVVILGDVDPRGEWMSPPQLQLLVDFVATRGGGLAFLAGERAMPARLRGTPLERLLPVRLDPRFHGRYDAALTVSFAPVLTPHGRRHPLFGFPFGPEGEPTDRNTAGLPPAARLDVLPSWYWCARVAGAAPSAEVLVSHPTAAGDEGPMPLIVLGRYGAGRTLFHGSDDTWRWRQFGEGVYQNYWLGAIRLLARHARFGGQMWRFMTEQSEHHVGDPVRMQLSALDPSVAAGVERVEVSIRDANGDLVGSTAFERSDPLTARFEAEWQPTKSGAYVAEASVPDTLGGMAVGFDDAARATRGRPELTFEVLAPDFETRRREADHHFLAWLAERSGGRCVTPDEAAELASVIPDRRSVVPDDVTRPLWDTPLAMLLFASAILLEWLLRKTHWLA